MPGMQAATPALAHSPLEPQLQRAGATMVARHGWWVAAHFGSPAGELALCETAVGLADRSDLGKLELRGEAAAIELLVGQLSGGRLDPGDALLAEGAWWCAVSPGPRARAVRRRRDRRACAPPRPRPCAGRRGATITDVTPRYAALGLLGPRTADVLTELSDSEPPLGDVESPAFDVLRLAAVPAMLLRGAPGRAVVVTEAGRAAALWAEVERAGREAGIGHVGADAVSHLSPLARPMSEAPARRRARRSRRSRSTRRASATASSPRSSPPPTATPSSRRAGSRSRRPPSGSGCPTTRGCTCRSCSTWRCGCTGCCASTGSQSAIERDHAMNTRDAEVIIAGACLLHDLGMSIHRVDHEAFSLFLAADALDRLLDGHLRGARAHDRRLGDPARDHRPPQRRPPAHARGRDRPRGRRARHGARPLAHVAGDPPREHPLAVGRRDRRGPHRRGRVAPDPRSRSR